MKLTRKQVVLDDDKTPDLERIAQTKGVSVSAIIRWAIDDYVERFFLTTSSNDCIEVKPTEKELQPA